MKFFVNEIPFQVVQQTISGAPFSPEVAVYSNPDISQIIQFYELAKSGNVKGQKGLVFLVEDYMKTVHEIKSHFKILKAAGGIVKKGESLLFIHRLGKWDLPKGKLEKGEKSKIAAVREVEEECGVKAEITQKIESTWHTYVDRKGRDILKETVWYAMNCLDDSQLTPQTEENISEVKWIPISEVKSTVLKDTYNSIREIYSFYES